MGSTVDLGEVTVRCPRCRSTQLEYDDAQPVRLEMEVHCARCGHRFRAEAGIDSREVERRAAKYMEKEVQKAFKGMKGLTIKL